MKNNGKKFEENFKKSVPDSFFFYRFRDGTASWNMGNNENVRFQQSNIADCMIFNGHTLYICELKNHKGKSIPLSCIRNNQKKMMLEASKYSGIACYLIVFFEDIERCFALNILDFEVFIHNSDRKSIPLSYFEKFGHEIPVIHLKTNYRYDLRFLAL